MSKILVTGGSGFIGTYVMKKLLEEQNEVVNYDLLPCAGERSFVLGSLKEKIPFVRGGIEDLPNLISVVKEYEIEKIAHLAAIVDPEIPHKNPSAAFRLDLGGTINVLEAARLMSVQRVVLMSSIGVYTSKKYEPIDENHPVLQSNEGPASAAYGACKIGAEAFSWAFREAFGLDFVALRPSAVYGLGMGSFSTGLLIKPIVESAVRGRPLRIEHGRDYPRDYTYVKDVASAVQLALDVDSSRLKDRVFLVATGDKLVTPAKLLEIVRRLIPSSDVEVGPGLDEFDKKEILMRGVLNVNKAKDQLGYQREYDIEKGVNDYVEMFREYMESLGATFSRLADC